MAIIYTGGDQNITTDRSAGDRKRHREKVRNAIKENIGNIVSEEAIIGQSGDKKIKVPIKGIKEYRFIYGKNAPGASTGDGSEKQGDIIPNGNDKKQGAGGPGSDTGEEIYETEITLSELTEILFEDLELPDLERKKFRQTEQERLLKPKGYKRTGVRVRLSKEKTVKEKLKRKKAYARALNEKNAEQIIIPKTERFPFHNDDLRFKRVKPKIKKNSNAVVFCIMDVSGSMDTMKKYLARSFYFLLGEFIKTKYQNTEIIFIAHHAEANEVTEDEFFHRAESGGTKISSGYKKALEIIEQRYNPNIWNIYAFHCSDGDNFNEDNADTLKNAEELAKISNLFGYGEIKPESSYSWSSMLDLYKQIAADNFVTVKIHNKDDLWPAFRTFLTKEKIKN